MNEDEGCTRREFVKGVIGAVIFTKLPPTRLASAEQLWIPNPETNLNIHPAIPQGPGISIGQPPGFSDRDRQLALQILDRFPPSVWYQDYTKNPLASTHPFLGMINPESAGRELSSNEATVAGNEPNDLNQNTQTPREFVARYREVYKLLKKNGRNPAVGMGAIAYGSVSWLNFTFDELKRQQQQSGDSIWPDFWKINMGNTSTYDPSKDPYDADNIVRRIREVCDWMDNKWITEPLVIGEIYIARDLALSSSHFSDNKDADFLGVVLQGLNSDPVIRNRVTSAAVFPLLDPSGHFGPLARMDGSMTPMGEVYLQYCQNNVR